MRYEAISRVNGGCWESDPYVGEIEADSCEDALEQYLDVIADNLRAVNAVFSGKCGDIVEYRYLEMGKSLNTIYRPQRLSPLLSGRDLGKPKNS